MRLAGARGVAVPGGVVGGGEAVAELPLALDVTMNFAPPFICVLSAIAANYQQHPSRSGAPVNYSWDMLGRTFTHKWLCC